MHSLSMANKNRKNKIRLKPLPCPFNHRKVLPFFIAQYAARVM